MTCLLNMLKQGLTDVLVAGLCDLCQNLKTMLKKPLGVFFIAQLRVNRHETSCRCCANRAFPRPTPVLKQFAVLLADLFRFLEVCAHRQHFIVHKKPDAWPGQ